jgi:hypothetical protein
MPKDPKFLDFFRSRFVEVFKGHFSCKPKPSDSSLAPAVFERSADSQPLVPIRRQNVAVSVNHASPTNARLPSDRLAASGCPAPHASVITIGAKPRSAACRTVGSTIGSCPPAAKPGNSSVVQSCPLLPCSHRSDGERTLLSIYA